MTNLEAFFTSPECDIYYNRTLNIIQTRWKGIYVEGARLREIFDQIIYALEKNHCAIIIADARDMLVISQADQQWTADVWYPKAVKAGFRYQGLILSKDTFNELSVKRISATYDSEIITTMYFKTPSAALDWVRAIRSGEAA